MLKKIEDIFSFEVDGVREHVAEKKAAAARKKAAKDAAKAAESP